MQSQQCQELHSAVHAASDKYQMPLSLAPGWLGAWGDPSLRVSDVPAWCGSSSCHRGACQAALLKDFVKTVIAATAVIEQTMAPALHVPGTPGDAHMRDTKAELEQFAVRNFIVTCEYFKGCEWLQELMESHK